ncbi:MAG: Lysine-tRNA ligase [Candidatus Woesebacteria bacterium GW2011_GWA1_33_30]|nr:MAG: Lysine-tRNA ligase [Candidatus Woesebacteria bacterium GW2011_GWA1_33_30]
MDETKNVRDDRLEKLKKIKDLGIDPYPSKLKFDRKLISTALDSFGSEIAVAGRLLSLRGHGNVIFADLVDESGKIQLFFQKKVLNDQFKILKLIDIADFIAVKGKVIKTIVGEISIDISEFQILVKSIKQLPSMWYGLKDVEERYRKRYLDIILNNEVKNRLTTRSKIIDSIRDFLTNRGFIEVETPTLQPVYGGGFARPFSTHHNKLDTDFYLRISDEMYLKRLIIEDIFEYTAKKVLAKTTFEYQGHKISLKKPWNRYSLVESIKKFTGVDPLDWSTLEESKKAIIKIGIKEEKKKELNKIQTIGECIAFTFEEFVEEKLIQPTIIYDYPIEVSPLAKKCDDLRFTQRFEFFAFGSELGNNYTELNDPQDLNKRFIEEKKREKAGFDEAHQTDYDYLEAIEHGFPPTCGISIGIDRFVMLLTNAKSIKEVIPFPTLRPKEINIMNS